MQGPKGKVGTKGITGSQGLPGRDGKDGLLMKFLVEIMLVTTFAGLRKRVTWIRGPRGFGQGNIRSCVADGTSYVVKMEWYSGSKFVQFTVPAGKNIFEQTQDQNIPINGISTNEETITFAHGKGKFCHACVTGGVNRWGDTCWALTPESDNHRQCGCNSGGWAGEGIYYGGKKNPSPNKCEPQGGGFVGPKLYGGQKGNLGSLGLKVRVRCNKDDEWITMLSEEAGTGNGVSFENSTIRHLDISNA
jgi:hypothetical protein